MRGALKKRYHLFSHYLLHSNVNFFPVCVFVCVCVFVFLLIYTICVTIFCVSQEGLSLTESNQPISWLLKVSNS